jgi:hypothetical protein
MLIGVTFPFKALRFGRFFHFNSSFDVDPAIKRRCRVQMHPLESDTYTLPFS